MSVSTGGRCPNIAWAFWTGRKDKLPPRERLVFHAIAERADVDLTCAPTMDDLCDDTGLTRRTVWAAVHDLADRGNCIRIEKRREGLRYHVLRPVEAHRKPLVWDDQPEDAPSVPQSDVQILHVAPENITTPEVQILRVDPPQDAEIAHPVVQNLLNPLMKYPQESPRKEDSPRGEDARERALAPASANGNVVMLDTQRPILDAWEVAAAERDLPHIRTMTDKRRRQLTLRIREVGVDGMLAAIEAVRTSSYCTGDNDRGWRADFDFLLQPTTLLRTLEGRYADREKRLRKSGIAAMQDQWGLTPMHVQFDPEPNPDEIPRRIAQ